MPQPFQRVFCCSVLSYKTKTHLTMWSNSHALSYLPKWVENLSPHKNLHVVIYSSFMHNYQNLEARCPRCPSIGKWINKAMQCNGIHHYKEIHYQVIKRHAAATAKSFSRVRLCATPRQQPTRLPVPGILQARTLEWVAISFSIKRHEGTLNVWMLIAKWK